MKKLYKNSLLIIFFILIFIILSFNLEKIPYGFFCDEAAISLRAFELTRGIFSNFVNSFFYKHFNYINGILPVYTNLSFIFLFGINEFSVRLSSVFFSMLSLVIFYLILKKMKFRVPLFPIILLMAFTPIYFHISRINFGHMPSLFFMLLGYFLYKSNKYILSGLSFGIGLYGYSGFVLTIPMFVFFLVIEQIFTNKFEYKKYLNICKLILFFFFVAIPLIYIYFNNPIFSKRFNDKNNNKGTNIVTRSIGLMKNYPKYFSFDYLFLKGEIGMPNSFITRHSVRGSGELNKVSLIFLIAAVLFYIFEKNKIIFLPFFLMLIFYPLPDILTSGLNSPPYSFAIFSSFICFPFLIAYGYQKTYLIFKKLKIQKFFIMLISLIIFFESWLFLNNYFIKYPLDSSDYWGWQSGPKQIIDYLKTQSKNYDELYMTGYFNEPGVFIIFYDPYSKYKNIMIGGLDRYSHSRKQLFAIRIEENTYKNNFIIKKIIYYPDGKEAYYIGTLTKN